MMYRLLLPAIYHGLVQLCSACEAQVLVVFARLTSKGERTAREPNRANWTPSQSSFDLRLSTRMTPLSLLDHESGIRAEVISNNITILQSLQLHKHGPSINTHHT